jgi:hypothetical protein
MNNNIKFWIFYSSLSFYLMFLLNYIKLNKIEQVFNTFLGNFFVFTYTYIITSDIKFSIFFNLLGYFISFYKN